jgi:DNA-binding PadR family transcriptional regulator
MDNEQTNIKDDSNELNTNKDGLIESLKKTMKEHKKMHEAYHEDKKIFKSLPKYDRKLLKGMMKAPFFKIMILWLINKGRVHGYEIMNQLQSDSLDGNKLKSANPSKIYPILHDLEKNGLIGGTWEYQGKRKIKYYEITNEGKDTLYRIKNIYPRHVNKLLEEFIKDMFFKEDE